MREPAERDARVVLAVIVTVSAAVALAWVFYVPILEAPDETVHFEYSTALYAVGGLVAPRDAARLNVPVGRPIPDPSYLESQSAVAVIALKPAVKAPAGYGGGAYYGAVDRGVQRHETAEQLLSPPLLRYYPFGYYALDAAWMGSVALFTGSTVALFFAARSLSVALLVPSLLLSYLILRRLGCARALALAITGIIGLFPMTSMTASSVQPDNLSFTLTSLSLLAALELRRRPRHRPWTAVLGVALGALLVTKVHYFAVLAVAVAAMLVTQRLDRRDAHGWRLEAALLLLPAAALESIQVWTQWASPPLLAVGQLVDVPGYRAALAGGPSSTATYLAGIVGFSFLDHTFGREFISFWGEFGWVDTPLVLGSTSVSLVVWLLVSGMSMAAFGCVLARLAQVGYRLLRVARRGRPRRALRIACSNPVLTASLLLAAVLVLTAEGYPGIQGRYYLPVLPGVFWMALKYAPRALPGGFGPALYRMQLAGLVVYTLAGAVFAFPTLGARYYAHGRDLVPVARESLQPASEAGHYQVTRLRLPEATLGVGSLPPDRVAIVGWAVDDAAASPARTVFVDVDGRPFQEAVYGDDSPAAVAALHSQRYGRAGFDVILDTTRLTAGPHQLTIRVVSSDGRRLYAPGPPLQFPAGSAALPGSP